jgi:hypothetical protein
MATNTSDSTNTVILRDNFIDVIWDGPQDKAKVEKSNADTIAAAKKLQDQHKPLLLSIHIQNHPLRPDLGAYTEVLKIFRSGVTFERLVISGDLPKTIGTLVTTVIESFDGELEICFIPDTKEALAWLLNK